ncbi:MAG: hypothetical protein E7474_12340 [Ruminococcaceae bacterium]|nr:hypothetical protein [Oscillospiraceae bacterium]
MKIASSQVAMASSHELETHVSVKKASLEVRAEEGAGARNAIAAIYKKSGGDMVSAMKTYTRKAGRHRSAETEEDRPEADGAQQAPERTCISAQPCAVSFRIDEVSELKIRLLNKMLEALGGRARIEPIRIGEDSADALDLRGSAARTAGMRSRVFGMGAYNARISVSFSAAMTAEGAAVGTSSAGTLWQRVNAVSTERSERETTAFASKGLAVTEDGRRIDFNVEFAMSRAFTERFDALSTQQFVLTDPLVINLSGNPTSVSDVKFSFDLDGDGEKENISFAGKGSGFLALDRDGNGRIDDGSELFGTKSGDGFADLAAYDKDGNGWIDENDEVFAKLRVWVRDEDGTDRLLDLREADVGAIYLGSADTEFSLKDAATHETNAVIRRTGVYLKESGGAGTVSHVDLSC